MGTETPKIEAATEADAETQADPEEESLRLANLLLRLVRLSGRSVRSIEHELGVGSSALGKVLKGNIRLQISHVVMVCNVLGLTPAHFFQLAYPKKQPRNALVEELERADRAEAHNELLSDRREAEELVRRVLREIFSSLLAPE